MRAGLEGFAVKPRIRLIERSFDRHFFTVACLKTDVFWKRNGQAYTWRRHRFLPALANSYDSVATRCGTAHEAEKIAGRMVRGVLDGIGRVSGGSLLTGFPEEAQPLSASASPLLLQRQLAGLLGDGWALSKLSGEPCVGSACGELVPDRAAEVIGARLYPLYRAVEFVLS